MAVLTNTMMQGTAADTGDGDFQIEKSLRFNHSDAPNLQNDIPTGNTRIWTFSTWLKRSLITAQTGNFQTIFEASSGGSNTSWLSLSNGDDSVQFQTITSGSVVCSATTNPKLRDVSAWYHICIAVDTNHAAQSDRYKAYINGVLVPTNQDNAIEQYMETHVNNAKLTIGGAPIGQGPSYYLNGYLAETYLIDGLQLSPAAFGSFDSTGVWNPKAFALPNPNGGATWSSNITTESGSYHANGAAVNLFDGSRYTHVHDSNIGGWQKFSPSGGISYNQSVEVYLGNTPNTTTSNSESTLTITDDDGTVETHIFGDATGVWKTLVEGKGKFTEIKCDPKSADWGYWGGIKVDGVILVDGQTDPTTRNNLNDGRVWSDTGFSVTGGSYYDSNRTPAAMFDGDPVTECLAPNGQTVTWKPGLTGSKIEVLVNISTDSGTSAVFTNNGTSVKADALAKLSANTQGWYNVGSSIDSSSGMTWSRVASNNDVEISGVRVDGHVLIDSTVDNSFHLKFNDTTRNSALGKDSLNGQIATATGGLPILNTTDDFGEVKGSGNRTDSDDDDLYLAITGETIADVSNAINSSSATKSVSATGAALSTTESRFYGKAVKFVAASNQNLVVTHNTELNLGSGNFTIEGWVYPKTNAGMFVTSWANTSNTANSRILAQIGGANSYNARFIARHSGGQEIMDTAANTVPQNQWTHVAFVRNGNEMAIYCNGIKSATDDYAGITIQDPSTDWWFGRNIDAGGEQFDGYMQDMRIYKKAKYTAAFSPPNRNDFAVTNLTTATRSYSDNNQLLPDSNSDQTGVPSTGANASGAFDGNSSTNFAVERKDGTGSGDVGAVWTPNPAITGVTSLHFSGYQASNTEIRVNEGSWTAMSGLTGYSSGSNTAWLTCTSLITGAQITKIEVKRTSVDPNYGTNIAGIKINGTQLVNIGTADIDSSVDSPTSYGTDTGAGGQVRGNYCTLNPLDTANNSGSQTFKNGNLDHESTSSSGAWHMFRGTIAIPKGSTDKFYYEVELTNDPGSNVDFQCGWVDPFQKGVTASGFGDSPHEYCFRGDNGKKFNANSQTTYGSAYGQGDVIGVGYDNGSIRFWVNGTEQDSGTAAWTGISKDLMPGFATYTQSNAVIGASFNFGQRAFKHAQSGYKSICTHHIADTFSGDELNNPSKYFDIATFSGTQASRDFKFNFGPDFVWSKVRNAAYSHGLFDVIRGATKRLRSDTTDAEDTQSTFLTSFDSDGVGWGTGTPNWSGDTGVIWAWDAGTAANGSTNTDGDNITVAVGNQWVNATAGFSITKYAGDGSGAANNDSGDAVGHGLSAAPDFVIVKKIDGVNGWPIYHSSLNSTDHLNLQTTGAKEASNYCYPTHPTNTKVDIGNNPEINNTGSNYIMYCWTAIPGYSAFGSYEGTGNASTGPFVYTGFRPRFLLTKDADATGAWAILDTVRDIDGNGGKAYTIQPQWNGAEDASSTDTNVDILSNGFKPRTTWNPVNGTDGSGGTGTMIYAAFAEHPFKTARAK